MFTITEKLAVLYLKTEIFDELEHKQILSNLIYLRKLGNI